jgi:hypothetical protein
MPLSKGTPFDSGGQFVTYEYLWHKAEWLDTRPASPGINQKG